MGKSVYLAAMVLMFGGAAWAEHAITLEPETATVAAPEPDAQAPAAVAEPETVTALQAQPPKTEPVEQAVTVVPAPDVNINFPAEHDVYLVPAATREVCTTIDFGYGDVQTDCRMQPLQARAADPALRGVCITRYGRRTCY